MPSDTQTIERLVSETPAMPDIQAKGAGAISGANVPILQVGVSNFRLPLLYLGSRGGKLSLETQVSATVSLGADEKGVHMSRLLRTFYDFQDRVFTPELLEEVLLALKEDLESSRARLKLSFNYPIEQESLLSELTGYQYYPVIFEGVIDDLNRFRRFIHFDFVYSSACPCSAALAEHARQERGSYGIPHSQRSKARVSVEIKPGQHLDLKELQQYLLSALKTETQVMVKREDEQAFAELNGQYPKFVEDAARLIYEVLDSDERIKDFQVVCAHFESLHTHDAVAVINKGLPGGFRAQVDDFGSLLC
tara:strand:- start:21819 stop:22739 length:921 start_codon:yes stop_codon:yes gene_type:complete